MSLPGSNVSAPSLRARIKTGFYTGNGVDDRNIDIGIDLLSKNAIFVMIKNQIGVISPVFKPESLPGDDTMYLGPAASIPDAIQAFTNTGFQVGQNTTVNQNTYVFYYIAIWSEP